MRHRHIYYRIWRIYDSVVYERVIGNGVSGGTEMPIEDYGGNTFVSFLDLSGFTRLRNREKALRALNALYSAGYQALQNNDQTEGIFISDCGILFVRNTPNSLNRVDDLKSILLIIKSINKRMIESDLMLTTSVAYGEFEYQNRKEFTGIVKNLLQGHAYTSAYLDNDKGDPKIQPGQCRIVKDNLPDDITNTIIRGQDNDIFRMLKEREGDDKHYYYYWMRNNPAEIEGFEQKYKDACKLKGPSKYAEMRRALN
jgi:hypothetical protein